jgi:integrase
MGLQAETEKPPTIVNSSVGRTREYLTAVEVERLMATARKIEPIRPSGCDYDPHRVSARAPGFRGLRPTMASGRVPRRPLHVRRSKRGTPSIHPICGDELRALRRLLREQLPSPYVFCSERGGPMTGKSFHTLIACLGQRAGIAFPIHPHMLRHGCGYALANAGHDTRAI